MKINNMNEQSSPTSGPEARGTAASDAPVSAPFLASPFRHLFGDASLTFCAMVAAELALISLSMAPSFSLGILIDTVFATGSVTNLMILLTGLVICHFLEVVISRRLRLSTARLRHARQEKLTAVLLSCLGKASLLVLESTPPATVYNRLNSIRRIVGFFVGWYVAVVSRPIFFLVAFTWLLVESPVQGAVIVAMTAIYIYLYWFASQKLRVKYIEEGKRVEQRTDAMQEFAQGLRTLRIAGKIEAFYQSRTNKPRLAHAAAKPDRSVQLAESYSRMAFIVVLGIGALLVIWQHLTIGHLVIVNVIFRRVLSETRYLISRIRRYYRMRTATHAVSSFVDELRASQVAAERPGTLPPFSRIVLRDVSLRYPGAAACALQHVNVEIDKGRFIVLVGASGSGKTSLLKTIAQLYTPSSGTLSFVGSAASVERFSFVSQDDTIFRLTLHENIALHADIARSDVVHAIHNASAQHFVERLKGGYDAQLENGGRGLSQGQKLRILIARCFASGASVLFLDEPTSALDPESERTFLRNLRAEKDARTILMVTHRLAPAMAADMIVFLESGTVLESGAPKSLLKDENSAFSRWCRTQAGMADLQAEAAPVTRTV